MVFRAARLKLTAWYLIIIMLVSLLFSLVIYANFNMELNRIERFESMRTQQPMGEPPSFRMPMPDRERFFDPVMLKEAKRRFLLNLLLTNLGILLVSAGAGYFLAGRTLKPIELMLDDQKRFIADASHELRTPLAVMQSTIEVSLRDSQLDMAEAKDLIQSNLEEVGKLRSLTDHLLAMDRYDIAGSQKMFEPVDVRTALAEAHERVKTEALRKGIEVKYQGADIAINVHKDSLVDLLAILLDNAVKYSSDGAKVIVSSYESRKYVHIDVTDTGIGIAPKDIPYIFNRFYRADSSRLKEVPGGYGMGLSIAKKIVELHRGTILVDSVYGQGTTFHIKVPVKTPKYF